MRSRLLGLQCVSSLISARLWGAAPRRSAACRPALGFVIKGVRSAELSKARERVYPSRLLPDVGAESVLLWPRMTPDLFRGTTIISPWQHVRL